MSTTTETIPLRLGVSSDKLQHSQHREPLKTSGALDKYEHFDVTPVIGREYPTLSLKECLEAPNSDELIRDLAITSQLQHLNSRLESLSLTTRSFRTRLRILPQTGRSR